MKRVLAPVLAVFATLALGANLQAGFTAISDLDITSFRIEFSVAGVPTGTVLAVPTDLTISGAGFSFRNVANLGGPDTEVSGGAPIGPAHVGNGGAPADNDFATPFTGEGDTYARGDSDLSGSLVDPGSPAASRTYSDIVLADAFAAGSAFAGSSLTNSGAFILDSSQGFTAQIVLDAALTQSIMTTGLPAGGGAVSSDFSFRILGTGITVGGAIVSEVNFSPASLNTSNADAPTTFASTTFTSVPFTIGPGTYAFIGTQGTTAQFVVPEPGTLSAFALIGVFGVAARRRRRK